MTASAVTLDHAGVVGRDLGRMAMEFEQIGFRLTPVASHAGGRTGNRCVMLAGSYIELISTIGAGQSTTIDRFLARHAGVHIVALGVRHEAAAHARLCRAGIDVGAPSTSERGSDDRDAASVRVKVTLLAPPDLPEMRLLLVRQLTPEALAAPPLSAHPNNAGRMVAAVIATAEPAVTAARLSVLAGRPVQPDPAGGYALMLPTGQQLRVLSPASASAELPGAPVLPLPRVAGLIVQTTDRAAALRALLTARTIPHRAVGHVLLTEAGGTTLRFE